jgi:Pvc16 N-terminal domain
VPDFNVVADVSTTLFTLLNSALTTLGAQAEISDLQGTIQTNPARVTLFLFEVVEDPSAKNREKVRVPPPLPPPPPPKAIFRKKPAMALLLRYMLTPWSGDPATDHKMLGKVMQTLYDGAILSGTQLQGNSLTGTDQALKITLSPLTLEERAQVWYAIEKPYRLSVTYEVRVVNLDAVTLETIVPVRQRSTRYLGPEAAQ